MDNSTALFEVWLGLYMLLSGYLLPLELFPPWLAEATRWLPFRSMLAFPVEMVVGVTTRGGALAQFGVQAAWIAGLGAAAAVSWRRGLRRFAAFGG
jgi:ABC-2 type transport system permease protein